MCGISGWVDRSGAPAQASVAETMNETLRHRGPDDAGVALFANGALSMTRLAIIDLSTGRQPLTDEERRWWIVYNGEVYNFRELRTELESRGHRFRTCSDTEVILRSYMEWGERCVRRLRGMFAFAIAEVTAAGHGALPAIETLFLARDRVGEKPLYYFHDGRRLLFASE